MPEQAQELYKESALGLIPKEWEVDRLTARAALPKGQVSPLLSPYKKMVLVAPDHIETGTARLISKETAEEQNAISGKYLFAAGDVLYSKIRPYLRKAIIADFGGLCSADMYTLRPSDETCPRFLLSVVLGHHFSRFAESVSMRSGFPKINRAELAEFSTAWPPLNEQRQISSCLASAESKTAAELEALCKLEDLKKGLMDDLLSGQVRVTPLLKDAV
jgi:type I restriction enzyme S subunit